MTKEERLEVMIQCVGETCTIAQASRILNRSWATIRAMLEDGRLEYACGGDRVDTRSICDYICEPKQKNWEARREKIRIKYASKYAV